MTNPHSQVTIEKLRRATDARGVVFEPLDAAALAQQRNVHVVVTMPGQIRGNHCHRVGTEITTVLGPAKVSYREGNSLSSLDVPTGEAWRFVFPPGVAHAFQNIGQTPMVMVSFNTVSHDPDSPDTIRDPLL